MNKEDPPRHGLCLEEQPQCEAALGRSGPTWKSELTRGEAVKLGAGRFGEGQLKGKGRGKGGGGTHARDKTNFGLGLALVEDTETSPLT